MYRAHWPRCKDPETDRVPFAFALDHGRRASNTILPVLSIKPPKYSKTPNSKVASQFNRGTGHMLDDELSNCSFSISNLMVVMWVDKRTAQRSTTRALFKTVDAFMGKTL